MKYFLFLLLLWSPSFLFAQENETSDETKDESDYLVVVEDTIPLDAETGSTATKTAVPLRSVPASTGVVTSSLFNTQDAVVLGDALKNVSGLNVQAGLGTFDFFTVRGIDSLTGALVLTDGAPEPEASYYQLYNVERVEVLKGPGAFLYGGNPLSGSINLIRKEPAFKSALKVGTSIGHFETYRTNVDWNTSDGKSVAFRLNGTWQDAANYRDEKESKVFAVNPTLAWRLGNDSTLKLNFEFINNEYQPDAGLPLVNNEIPDVPRTRSYQSPFDDSDQEISRTRIDFAHNAGAFTFKNKFYFTDFRWDSNGTLFNGAFPLPGGSASVIRTLTMLDDHQKLTGNQSELYFEFSTGGIRHNLLAGLEISRLADDFTLDVALLAPIDLLNPVELSPVPGPTVFSQTGDTSSRVFAPYFLDQIALSSRLQFFVGGRFDRVDFEEQLSGTSRDAEQFSPLFGVTFMANSDLSFYFNAGKAFAPPSALVVGDLEPEESTQWEIGAKTETFSGKLRATVSLYSLDRKNVAIPDETGITRQNGDQTSRGIEVEVSANPAPGWHTTAAYAFNDSELTNFAELVFTGNPDLPFVRIDHTGNAPAFAPEHIFNFWALKDLGRGIQIGGGARYVGEQFISEDNLFEIDSYVLIDAMAAYNFKQWRLTLNVKNLTNREYESRGTGRFSVIPANPFAVYAGCEFAL